MAIDWTDAAIEAAHNAYWAAEESPTEENEMRAALDAAVKAQGGIYAAFYREAVQEARAEAFEEAAALAERLAPDLPDIADALRKLAEGEKK